MADPCDEDVAIPTTTVEENRASAGAREASKELATRVSDASALRTAGQRRINVIWEFTQASLTILITIAVIYAELSGKSSTTLNNGFFAVIATYLARTNHTKIGGVGVDELGR